MPDIIAGEVVDVYPFRIVGGRAQYLTLLRTPGQPLGDTWQSIHARIERKETAVTAAAREAYAQTGVEPVSLWNIDYVNNFYAPEEDSIYVVPSIGVLMPPEADVQLTPDYVNWEWVTPDAAMKRLVWVGQRLAIQTLQEEIAGPLAAGHDPSPYWQIPPQLYLPRKRGR